MAAKNEAACVCPKCGHCPTCGRSNQQQFVPYPYPYPLYPYGTWPYWQRPWVNYSVGSNNATGIASTQTYSIGSTSGSAQTVL